MFAFLLRKRHIYWAFMERFLVKILAAAAFAAAFELLFGWGELLRLCLDFARENGDPFAFLIVMGVGCAFPLSLSLCYLFAGAAFPFFEAWALCILGLFISSSIGFFFGRFLVPENSLESLAGRFKIGRVKTLGLANVNFFVRAVPGIPYFLQNIILGGMRTPFAMYAAVNLAVQGAIAAAMVYIGSAAASDSSAWRKLWVFGILVAVLFLAQRAMAFVLSRRGGGK